MLNKPACCWLLIALILLGSASVSGSSSTTATPTVPSLQARRLLQQPWAAGKSISRLSALAGQRGVDPRSAQCITASAGTALVNPVGVGYTVPGRFGGAAKNAYTFRSSSSQHSANASADYRAAGIAAPGVGRITGRSGADTLVMAQSNTTEVPPAQDSSSGTPPTPFRQDRIEVLFAAARDYAVAGDSAVVTLKDLVTPTPGFPRRGRELDPNIYALADDYGTPGRIPPETVDTSTTIRSWLDALNGRVAANGRTGATATGPSVTARAHATSASAKGRLSAEDRAGDLMTNAVVGNIVATPPVPLKQYGADAVVTARAESFKGQRPSVVSVQASADSRLEQQPAAKKHGGGARSSVLSYVAGVKETTTQAQTAAAIGSG